MVGFRRFMQTGPWTFAAFVFVGACEGSSVVGAPGAPTAASDGGGVLRDDGLTIIPTPPTTLGPGFVELPYALAAGVTLAPPGHPSNDPLGLTGGVAADLDGDGAAEILMGAVSAGGRTAMIAFRRGADGGLASFELPGVGSGLPLALVDLDGDGFVDLLQNAPSIAWGLGGGRFTAPLALDPAGDEVMGAAVADIDGDGWLDLLVGNRRCCAKCGSLRVLLREGPRRYAYHPELVPLNPTGGAYAVMANPLGPDPMVLATYTTCSRSEPVFFRPASLTAQGLPLFEDFDPTPPDAGFRAASPIPCPSAACRIPMGSFVGYVDEDDQVDLALSLNPEHALFRGATRYPLAEANPRSSFVFIPGTATARSMLAWGTAFIDLDRDGRPDAINVHGDDGIANPGDPTYVGPQHVTAHWNAGAFRLDEITALTHLGAHGGQWRSLFVGDFDGDADADLVVGGNGFAPVVYRNDVATPHRGLSIRLRGATSNAAGLGARVTVWARASSAPQRFMMGGIASPHSVSDAIVFVGLGDEPRAARVRVDWPSGVVQEVADLDAGRAHTIEEPPLFAVEPASRHVAADGASVATLRVTPRSPDGSVRAGARVAVAITHGAGEVLGVEADPGTGGAVARVRAPSRPGSARVEVRIDGVASPVHPRLWWD